MGVRFDIQNERDARPDCWSIENAVSEPSEPLTDAEYASRLEEIAEARRSNLEDKFTS